MRWIRHHAGPRSLTGILSRTRLALPSAENNAAIARIRKPTRSFDMKSLLYVRAAATAVVVACSRPGDAPAQIDATASPFAGTRDATVRAAAAALAAGRPWRATEIIDSASRDPSRRTPE